MKFRCEETKAPMRSAAGPAEPDAAGTSESSVPMASLTSSALLAEPAFAAMLSYVSSRFFMSLHAVRCVFASQSKRSRISLMLARNLPSILLNTAPTLLASCHSFPAVAAASSG